MKKFLILFVISLVLFSCDEATKEEKLEDMKSYLPSEATNVEIIKHEAQYKWCYFELDGRKYIFMKDGHGRALTEISK